MPYFYAAGKRVTLVVESSLWALDTEALSLAPIADTIRARILTDAHQLRGKYVLARLPAPLLAVLRAVHAAHPVYRAADAVLVALPEVRVEETRPERLRRLHAWLDARAGSIEVSEPEIGRITLRPSSGSAEEALAIANELHEEITPELAEARFIRSVESPDLKVKARARAPRRH